MLATFDADERPIVAETVSRAADAVELFIAEGIKSVMNRFNRKEEKEDKEEKEEKEDRE